jgi:ribonuclease VapC
LIIDSSAILAIVLLEPDEPKMLSAVMAATAIRMSAANWLETSIIVDSRQNRKVAAKFDAIITDLNIEIAAVSKEQAVIARDAYRRFGRGRHPAKLNYGDCFAYALALTTGEPLLFKGNDFSQTDVEPALRD